MVSWPRFICHTHCQSLAQSDDDDDNEDDDTEDDCIATHNLSSGSNTTVGSTLHDA